MKRLHVNVDHCATIRQARGTSYPDPVVAASIAELAGAHGITVHLREDRRHIQDRDLPILRETVQTTLNMEMAATDEMLEIALRVKPDIVTLVPERRAEQTTEGGLDVHSAQVAGVTGKLKQAGIPVSLFVAPDVGVINQCAKIGAETVELHTGDYCHAAGPAKQSELRRLKEASELAASLKLDVAAGHGLDYSNVKPIFAIPEIREFNIGHSIIGRAILVGMDRAVRDMLALMNASCE